MEAGTATGTLTPDVSKILGSPELANNSTRRRVSPACRPPRRRRAVGDGRADGRAAEGSSTPRSMLAPEQRTQVESYAKGIFPKLAEDPNQLDAFGSEAVEADQRRS